MPDDDDADTMTEVVDIEDIPTPFQQFRQKRGTLSVTDLTSLEYCETQFDYRLRIPRGTHPSSIISRTKKPIAVDKAKAKRRGATMQRGTDFHKELELEDASEIEVEVETKLEVWGLRLVMMIDRLDFLLATGSCRELPTFGFVGDHLIIGIIDQIRTVSPSEGGSEVTDGHAADSRRQIVRVSDVKTRQYPGIPNDNQTQMLQVATYGSLLKALVQDASANDGLNKECNASLHLLPTAASSIFSTAFSRAGLDEEELFSPTFQTQFDSFGGRCLEDYPQCNVGMAWNLQALASMCNAYLAAIAVDDRLELWYYCATNDARTRPEPSIYSFDYSAAQLARRLEKSLRFWNGNQRIPEGVAIEKTSRCNTCEFVDDCEWRIEQHEKIMRGKRKRIHVAPVADDGDRAHPPTRQRT